MPENKIVVRYVNRRTIKGTTNNFSADKPFFHFLPLGASPNSVPLEIYFDELKAVFFVKEFDSKPGSRALSSEAPNIHYGRHVTVVFKDGEVLKGTTTSYNINRPGFFMIPDEPTSNNERCFVVRKATKNITVT
ncbi:MAG: hypothetical protein KBA28_02775 [Syntrophaceae bacterium]|nr:hypothetical protein [Syntrophaceae bacterium]